jgi:predicted amidohydrolase YtcJ
MKKIAVIAIAITLLLSCSSQKKHADFIVTNAKIYTIDNDFSLNESFAVKDGKFVAIGTSEEILSKYNVDTIIDLKGKTVYPGFYDAHCHFYGYGLNLQKANLVGTKSFDEVIERVKQHAESHPSEWILGRGWDQNDWEVKEFPTNEQLDEAFPDKPVVLKRIDGHALIANSEALKGLELLLNQRLKAVNFLKRWKINRSFGG